jgi:multidrug resistance efflux pump
MHALKRIIALLVILAIGYGGYWWYRHYYLKSSDELLATAPSRPPRST